jgi:hypothetical protein
MLIDLLQNVAQNFLFLILKGENHILMHRYLIKHVIKNVRSSDDVVIPHSK